MGLENPEGTRGETFDYVKKRPSILFFLFGIFLDVFPLSIYTLIRRCRSGAEKDDDEVFALLRSGAHEDERTQKALK
jgi:hypothetical protein